MTLLRMELRPPDIGTLNHRGEVDAVVGGRKDVIRPVAHEMIGVHKVKARVLVKFLEQGARPLYGQLAPPHMWNFERRRPLGPKANRLSFHQAETGQCALFASTSQELHSQTDAEHGNALCRSLT